MKFIEELTGYTMQDRIRFRIRQAFSLRDKGMIYNTLFDLIKKIRSLLYFYGYTMHDRTRFRIRQDFSHGGIGMFYDPLFDLIKQIKTLLFVKLQF